MTLEAGDVILTGTPKGVSHVHPGDVMRLEIDGLGALENPVALEDESAEPLIADEGSAVAGRRAEGEKFELSPFPLPLAPCAPFMPHLTLEYTDNLTEPRIPELLRKLNGVLLARPDIFRSAVSGRGPTA